MIPDAEVVLANIDNLEGNPLIKLQQVNFALRERLPQKPHFTQQALSTAIEGRIITFKIARDCPAERNSEENIEDHCNYALWILSPDVIKSRKTFVVEFGVNSHMRRTQGKSAEGDRACRMVSAQKGPNVTSCCAVSPEGLLHYQIIQDGMKKKIFKNFLEVPCGNIIFYEGNDADGFCTFDKAPGHRGIKDMNLSEIFPLKRLPKYSPFLTMVEAAISYWKAAKKRKMQEEMGLFIHADALTEPGQTLQEYRFRHVKSIVERTSCEITTEMCWLVQSYDDIYPGLFDQEKNRWTNKGCCIKFADF